jgi:hypothetical protein
MRFALWAGFSDHLTRRVEQGNRKSLAENTYVAAAMIAAGNPA